MGHTGFDDHVRLHLIQHLLDAHDVFGQLDDRASHPRERVGVALVPAHLEPLLGNQVEGAVGIQRHGFRLPVVVEGQRLLFSVEGQFHRRIWSWPR